MDQPQQTTVVVADDHAIVREGIVSLCTEQGLTVVGQCSDGEAAVKTVIGLKPHFAIIDVAMPKMDGIEVIRKLRADGCTSKLMILTVSREQATVEAALQAGADAYILKDGPSRHFQEAIDFARDGGVWISPLLRDALSVRSERDKSEDPLAALSPREMEVFSYLVNGLRSKDIADLLNINPESVDTYRASLMRKLNIHDLVGMVRHGIERNPSHNLALLTDVEWTIYVHLVMEGMTPIQIAEQMRITVEDVYTHRFRIMQKLNIQSFDPEPPELA